MDYPVLECIEGLLSFSDELCIADGGSTDSTVEMILDQFPQVLIESFPIDKSRPRWAIHSDGYLKTHARKLCQGDILWQSDNDEVIHPDYAGMAKRLCEISYERRVNLTVPLVEFWGSPASIRLDVSPKPRITLNKEGVVHGIRKEAKVFDKNGDEYCKPFISDSCEYVDDINFINIPFEDAKAHPFYIWHLSWLDFRRKILHYKNHWHAFHKSMYNLNIEDTSESNMMFDKPWSEVNDDDINEMIIKLRSNGPRFFHQKQEKWTGAVHNIDDLRYVSPPLFSRGRQSEIYHERLPACRSSL